MEGDVMNLTHAQEGKEYIVSRIDTDDEELDAFLFSLGCYSGEPITVIAHRKHGCVIQHRYPLGTGYYYRRVKTERGLCPFLFIDRLAETNQQKEQV